MPGFVRQEDVERAETILRWMIVFGTKTSHQLYSLPKVRAPN
jgi:hypothetical protein